MAYFVPCCLILYFLKFFNHEPWGDLNKSEVTLRFESHVSFGKDPPKGATASLGGEICSGTGAQLLQPSVAIYS